MNEKQRLDTEPIVLPTFEQKQLIAIVAALEPGQMGKAALLKRRFLQGYNRQSLNRLKPYQRNIFKPQCPI